MRILFAIAHYWKPPSLLGRIATQLCHAPVDKVRRLGRQFAPRYGSMRRNGDKRARALTACIENLHTHFGSPQGQFDRITRSLVPANVRNTAKVDVIVCVSGSHHVLDRVRLPAHSYARKDSDGDPMHLSFECRDVLKAHMGDYDFYCFLEDDILLHDALFFDKLRWFSASFGDHALLQPSRFERSCEGPVRKLYIDEMTSADIAAPFQDIATDPELTALSMNNRLVFRRHPNPHSGCYFLNAAQMRYWAAQPHFGARDPGFVGPLESGASLGIMQTFNVYKPALEMASFLEVEHLGDAYLRVRAAELTKKRKL